MKQQPRYYPGGAKGELASMIRVDQAGEYGAKRIYAGQLAVIRDPKARAEIAHMAEQEEAHLAAFNRLVAERGIRPTLLQPLWHVGGFLLGAATAALGKEAAMACTVAVESVIDEHYAEQEAALSARHGEETALKEQIARFRAEEMEHHATGLAAGAEQAPGYPALSAAIRGITRAAIALSKRI